MIQIAQHIEKGTLKFSLQKGDKILDTKATYLEAKKDADKLNQNKAK